MPKNNPAPEILNAEQISQRCRVTFSLRTILLIVSFLAMLIACWVEYRERPLRQRRIVEQLARDAGLTEMATSENGDLCTSWRCGTLINITFGTRMSLRLQPEENKSWIASVYPAGQLMEVTGIDLQGGTSELLDSIVLQIRQLDSIRKITIVSQGWRDRHCSIVQQMPLLTEFSCSGNVTDHAIGIVCDCPLLAALSIQSDLVTDAGIRALVRLPRLNRLHIASSNVTGAGIAELPALEHLTVCCPEFSITAFRDLSGVMTLKSINIQKCRPINTKEAAYLAALPHLSVLGLSNVTLSDGALREICKSRSIAEIALFHVFGTNLTADGLGALRTLPLVAFYTDVPRDTKGLVQQLSKITTLRKIGIIDCEIIDDESVDILSQMTWLSELDVPPTAISLSRMSWLKTQLPMTSVNGSNTQNNAD